MSQAETVRVFLGGEPRRVGTVRYAHQGARESAAFEYDAEWLSDPARFAIDPALPLVPGPQFHRKARGGSVFHSVIADTEPDGWGRRVILRDHAKRRKQGARASSSIELLHAVDFLLEVDDFSRVGALRFQTAEGVFRRAPDPGRRTAPPLIELDALLRATRAVETQSESAADLEYLRGRGTSLGGLRPKCTVVDENGRLSIGKFPSVLDERAVTKGEVLAMRLARTAGIDAAEARLVHSQGTPVALIRRFDRPSAGRRLMYASAATMLGVEPGDAAEHAYTELVDVLRVNGSDAAADIEELWRRIAFSILITNVDDHLLNHGFIHVARGQWRLSPAFDLNPFPERVRELKTWISEESGPAASIEALMSVTPYFRISLPKAKDILRKAEGAISKWRAEGRSMGMTKPELDLFADAFEHPERLVARRTARRVVT